MPPKTGGHVDGSSQSCHYSQILRNSSLRPVVKALPAASMISIIASIAYLAFRSRSLLAVGGSSTMWMTLLVEFLASFPTVMTQIGVVLSVTQAKGDRLPQHLSPTQRPRVDVFITHCGEGHDVVLDTVRAACILDWPSESLRIIVLDDSGSSELHEKIKSLNQQVQPHLLYASRGFQVLTYSKAANLNFGLRLVESLTNGPAEFVAVLDVDMIPEPDWLCQVVPHVLNNDKAGLACPPQRYYNLPANDPLGILTDDLPGECMIRLQDYTDASFCTGSGFVARRSALDEIGGIPEETLQEDDLTSYKLLAAGWCSVYVPTSVQWGLGPDTFAGYLKQSKRWAVGIIHVNSLMWKPWAKKLSRTDRSVAVLWAIVIGSTAFIWTFVLLTLPVLVACGDQLIPLHNCKGILRLAAINFVAQSSYHLCLTAFLDFRMPIHTLFGAVWTQPWKMMSILQYFVTPWLLKHEVPHFEPTGLAVHGNSERLARTERSYFKMCKVVFWDCGASFHLFILGIAGLGVSRWAYNISSTWVSINTALLVGILWPPVLLLWAALVRSAWIPLAYVIQSLPLLPRQSFLVHDSTTGIQRVSWKAKSDHMNRARQDAFLLKCLVYVGALLIAELT